MIDPSTRRQWAGSIGFALAALVVILSGLLPLRPGWIGWPGPDLLLPLTFAWVLRRPEQVPVLLIAAVFMVDELVTMRPFGLWAALAVIATEAARRREHRWREQSFLLEWLRVATLMLAMMLADRIVQAVVLVPPDLAPRPPLGQLLLRLLATVAAYPAVVAVARVVFGLRRAGPGELDQ